MVNNINIKCQVCGSVTRVRLQVGYLKHHPIVVPCYKCGISLCGEVVIGQDSPSLKYNFENADIVNKSDSDYIVECSGEFPVNKICEDNISNYNLITPFIRISSTLKDDKREGYFNSIASLNMTTEKWNITKRIFDLFQTRSPYLTQEIKKEYKGSLFSCNNEAEILRSVHNIEILSFYMPLRQDIVKNIKFSEDILRINPVQMKALVNFLNSHDGYQLEKIQAQIYSIQDKFIKVYPSLIPAICLQYIGEDNFDYEKVGSSTSTFDSIKEFYIDVYETLCNLLIIPVAFDNIKYRDNYNQLSCVTVKNACSLEDFINLSKADRIKYCNISENKGIHISYLKSLFNSKLRNAVGHNDYEYNSISQEITYYPDPKNRSRQYKEYLLECENEVVHMFQGILAVSEFLYRLRELKMMHDGNASMIECMSKKINVYDLCPCGSGKKYKFCHKKSSAI